jgi:hypothetical protein
MNRKSIHNPCPVCGKPRGKGPDEFAHGACLEQRAATDGKQKAGLPGSLARLTVEHVENGKARRNAKAYRAGRLPDWMFS